MKEAVFSLMIDPEYMTYETLLDEAIHAQEAEWLSLAIDPKKKRKQLSSIEKRYPLPDGYKVDFTVFHSAKSRKNVYAYIWSIHENQFLIVRGILQKLSADGILMMNEYDYDVEADAFHLTKLTQGNLLIQDQLYSFNLTFVSKSVGTIKTTVLVTETDGYGDLSISTIDFEKIPVMRKIEPEQPVQKGSVKNEYKHRGKKNKA